MHSLNTVKFTVRLHFTDEHVLFKPFHSLCLLSNTFFISQRDIYRLITFRWRPLNTTANAPWPIRSRVLYSYSPTWTVLLFWCESIFNHVDNRNNTILTQFHWSCCNFHINPTISAETDYSTVERVVFRKQNCSLQISHFFIQNMEEWAGLSSSNVVVWFFEKFSTKRIRRTAFMFGYFVRERKWNVCVSYSFHF